jgi:hypothetical protein
MVGGFGVWLIFNAIKTLKPQKMNITAMRPLLIRIVTNAAAGITVGINMSGDWKTRLGVILAIGARPVAAQS